LLYKQLILLAFGVCGEIMLANSHLLTSFLNMRFGFLKSELFIKILSILIKLYIFYKNINKF
jgi:hypothetical protein